MYLEEVLCAVERGADLRLEQDEPSAAVLGSCAVALWQQQGLVCFVVLR
jgi:hypothetical protein